MYQTVFRILGLLFIASVFVPTVSAQTRLGLRAGLNLSGIHLVDELANKQGTGIIPRLQIGLTLDIPITSDFYLQPAAVYSGKGYVEDGGWLTSPDNEFKATASYVEVPVNLLYRPKLGNGNWFIGTGLYVGYGIGGKWEGDQKQVAIGDIMIEPYGDVIFKNDFADGEFANYIYGKPWDYGVNVLAGYEFLQNLSVQLNAQFGIANLQPTVGGIKRDGEIKNVVYGISFGYRL